MCIRDRPFTTPPRPTEAFAAPGTHQMPPYLLLYPAFDHSKTNTRMTDPKVVHPAPQNRIDFRNHGLDGPADVLSEDLPELCELLAQPFVYRLHQPVTPPLSVNQDHHVVRKTCILDTS